MTSPRVKFKNLKWDSQQLSVACGLIDLTGIGSAEKPAAAAAIKKLAQQNCKTDFITIKVPLEKVAMVNELIHWGARLIEAEITFCFPRQKKPIKAVQNRWCFCKFVKTTPPDEFVSLAAQMHHSRFFLDKMISFKKAKQLWEASLNNYCQGRADELVIAYFRGKPAGIVTLNFNKRQGIDLFIVGVKKDFQRRHIGAAMLNAICARYAHKYSIIVQTQANNLPACRLYQSQGFGYCGFTYVLHYWRNQAER